MEWECVNQVHVERWSPEEISGTTLRVYTYLYLHPTRGVGAREVQRVFGFKSPSSAIFQLEKLREKGLATKEPDGEYHLLHWRKIGILHEFVTIRRQLVPRMLFYAIITSVVTGALMTLYLRIGTLDAIIAFIPSLLAAMALWVEASSLWKRRPRFKAAT